jgi:hypothetical protein
MAIASAIQCSHCGAPVEFKPGELIATCKYCGFTTVIQTGKAFNFEHSLILNNYNQTQIEELIRNWMRSGFMKPRDLPKKSKITEKSLSYLPFWVITLIFTTKYQGVFERISPPILKEGELKKEYNWLILARKASGFPTREYNVPLAGKIPYDFRKIEEYAKVLNSEIEKDQAVDLAKQQIESHHRFLLQQDVDKIIELTNDADLKQTVYLHAPVWFVKYEYKGKIYQLVMDGSSGNVIKGDIPRTKF